MSFHKYVSGQEFLKQLNNAYSEDIIENSNWTSDEMICEYKFNKTVIITIDENWCNPKYTNDSNKIYRQSINNKKYRSKLFINTGKRTNTSKVCPYFLKGMCGDEHECNLLHPDLPHKLRRKNRYW